MKYTCTLELAVIKSLYSFVLGAAPNIIHNVLYNVKRQAAGLVSLRHLLV